VISYDAEIIRLELCDFGMAGIGGPSGRTTVSYSPPGPHLPGRSPS